MKQLLILILLSTMTHLETVAQKEKEDVKKAVISFVEAADAQNAEKVAEVLDEKFRLILNQLFGSSEVTAMDKPTYLQLIKDKKLGGDKRSVEFVSMEIVNQNASVRVKLKGSTLAFESFIQLIKTPEGKWKLINDLPYASKI